MVITSISKDKKHLNKTELAAKLNISRPTLDKLLKEKEKAAE